MEKFTYPGVQVPKDFNKLFVEILSPRVKDLEQNVERWPALNLSIAGKINTNSR